MASRRTRIKTIANIPQRRRVNNGETKIEEKPEEDGSNLISSGTNENVENVEKKIEQQIEDESNNKIDSNDTPNVENTIPEQIPPSQESLPNPEIPPTVTSILNTPKVLPRRKFIKPPIAVNTISRKFKKEEDEINKNSPTINTQPEPKIVVHDQIILQPPINTSIKEEIIPNETLEYPIPPPSPNKNRSRIKAIPRFSQRHTSFSASESEDEFRKNNRNRNDSVCSTTSGIGSIHEVTTPNIIECTSPQKPKEFNTLIQKKCRRTEQSRKLAEARRDFHLKFGNNKPDRQKLTMLDLIFYNPTTNLMSQETKRKRTDTEKTEKSVVEQKQNEEEEKNNEGTIEEAAKSGSDEENEIPAPQIKIGPQGEIVVDEQSLVVENKAAKKNWEALQNSEVIDGNFESGYGVYKRVKRSKDWTKQETLKFYKALNSIGTDFSLMSDFFPGRSRRELKMKFKKEERINQALVDRALKEPTLFNFTEFKQQVDMEQKELAELERQKEVEQQLKKETGRKRNAAVFKMKTEAKKPKLPKLPKKSKKRNSFDIMSALTDSDADDEVESELGDDEDVEDNFLQNMQKPTRYGRVPKLLTKYQDETKMKIPANNGPGSLMVMTSTGANGDPVYRVFMVTDDHNSETHEVNSLSEALKLQNTLNVNKFQNIFTLTAEEKIDITPEKEEEKIEENNYTIVEDTGEVITS